MSELSKSTASGAESSSDETDNGQQNREQSANPNTRAVPMFPLAKSSFDLLNLNQRKSVIEAPVRPPLPLEKIEDDDDEEDEDEDTGKDEQKARDNNAPAEAEVAAAGEAVEPNPDTAAIGEAVGAAELNPVVEATPDAYMNAEAVGPAGSAEAALEAEPELEPKEEVFETFAPAASKTSEFMDIPRVEDKPKDKPAAKPTFEEILRREMPADFIRDTSGETLGGPDKRDIRPAPSRDMPEVGSPFDPGPGEDPRRSRSTSTTPFSAPSWGPAPGSFEAGGYAVPSGPEPAPASRSLGEVPSAFSTGLEALKAATDLAEQASNPNRLVTRVLTQVALEGFLTKRKQERYDSEPLLHRQKEELIQLNDQQRRANERLNALFQKQAEQTAQVSGEQEIFDQNGNKIALQSDQHLERGTAGYISVVDAHGRPVIGAVNYGEAYKQDQRREQLGDDIFAKLNAGGGGVAGDGQSDGGFAAPLPPMAGQGGQSQTNDQHQPYGQSEPVDLNHRLSEPRNYIRDAALNPWLWTAVAVIIIVYFVASLA